MQSVGAAAPDAAFLDTSARAEASRRNGARSRGPRTRDGKARSSQNALKHGMRAQRFVVLADEDAAEYEAHEAALLAELAPEGALQAILARRVAAATWRLMRADRMEAELFENQGLGDGDLGLALVRDGHGARAFQTLLRYRGAAQAELWRALRTLKALQAEAETADAVTPAVARGADLDRAEAMRAIDVAPRHPDSASDREENETPDERAGTIPDEMPFEPEARADPDGFEPAAAARPAAPTPPVAATCSSWPSALPPRPTEEERTRAHGVASSRVPASRRGEWG